MAAPSQVPATPIRNSYWVLPGKVLAGENPSATNTEATRERLGRLLNAGVECFIDLTEPGEVKRYDSELPFGIEYLRKPIKDHGIPGQRGHMAEILDCLHDAMRSGRCVYVHCRAGIGRTGTVIGCFLVERGLTGEAALDELNRLWQQCERSQGWASIPETDDQANYVRRWKARGVFDDSGQLKTAALGTDDADELHALRGGAGAGETRGVTGAEARAGVSGVGANGGATPWAHLLIDDPQPGSPASGGRGRGSPSPRTSRAARNGSSNNAYANARDGRAAQTATGPARQPGGAAARQAGAIPANTLRPNPAPRNAPPPNAASADRSPPPNAPGARSLFADPASVARDALAASSGAIPSHTPRPNVAPPNAPSPGAAAAGHASSANAPPPSAAAASRASPANAAPPSAAAPSGASPASDPSTSHLFADPASVAHDAIAAASGAPTVPTRVEGAGTSDAAVSDRVEDADPLLDPEALAAASQLRTRFLGVLLGLAIGDAVAAATQFRRPGSFTPVGDMLGGGPFDLPRGAWSDDTAMTLCLADSLLERNGFDARDQVERYRRWQQHGYLSATGQCVGITASSARAIAMARWRRQAFAGSHDPAQLDPEPLSRVAAAVLFFFAGSGQAIDQATEAARTTCQAPAVLDACRSLARALHAALSGQPKATVLEMAAMSASSGATTAGASAGGSARIIAGSSAAPPGPLGSTGAGGVDVRVGSSAPAALAAAAAAFGATDNFRDAILYAVNLGGDSDVVAAVCGQLAGAYYGVKAIPTSWYNGLMQKELIISYADRLLARAMLGLGG